MDFHGRLVRIRRQDEGVPSPVAESSTPPASDSPVPTKSASRLVLPVPAIAGIVVVGLILIGLTILLWRWRVRLRQLRRFSASLHNSVQKYGVGRGISSSNSNDSMQKMEIHGSFFESDDPPSRKRSTLTFKVTGKMPQSPTTPKGPKSPVSTWFNERPKSGLHYLKKKPSHSPPRAEGKRSYKVQHLPDSVRTKCISAPLHIVNGPAEPWTPATPSPMTATPSSRQSEVTPPQRPPPVAFPQTLRQQTQSTLSSQPQASNSGGDRYLKVDQLRLSLSAISSDGSLYSRNSLSSTADHQQQASPVAGGTAAPPPGIGSSSNLNSQTQTQRRQHSRKPSTPPLPPSSTTLNYGHRYESELQRPGSAGSQHHPSLPRLMTAITRFVPTLDDELLLQVGDTVRVIEEYRDGWCLVQQVGRIDSPRGVVPAVCLQERRRIVPVPVSVVGSPSHKRSNASLASVKHQPRRIF
ncbi:hypothetical protein CC1G_12842 [Coprinopsis cinerea okayama7|uniref:SH3 domain-containing protein n=1 Tax=Coprinopsis cinerea (strain Okayama-7 / 130 / ATCC MYA-4618 / FGSC 9003) TaxID=240176 RepID=A8NE10_COPC7|nr:hypothetical protein CC1G_12842 [Coprinopsis cinerea okayama7\|eukprot:XP_001832914.2 hypothetical protein CC1G_12842 [Coprinopsis cinerea okayama7\